MQRNYDKKIMLEMKDKEKVKNEAEIKEKIN
jgi:hypothetical protein